MNWLVYPVLGVLVMGIVFTYLEMHGIPKVFYAFGKGIGQFVVTCVVDLILIFGLVYLFPSASILQIVGGLFLVNLSSDIRHKRASKL